MTKIGKIQPVLKIQDKRQRGQLRKLWRQKQSKRGKVEDLE